MKFLNQIENAFTKTTSTTTADQVLDTFSATSYIGAKYLIHVVSGTSMHFTEIMLVYYSVTPAALMSEYGTIVSNSALATFTADISSGSVRLLVTPVNASTTYKIIRSVMPA